jgi:histone-binding protein RBBP4
MRVWAGDAVKIDEKELEGDAMEGVEPTSTKASNQEAGPSGGGNAKEGKNGGES